MATPFAGCIFNLELQERDPGQCGTDPWQFATDPWQCGTDPWQCGTDPWQFATDPWQFAVLSPQTLLEAFALCSMEKASRCWQCI